MSETAALIAAGMHPAEATSIDRDDAIKLIRDALRKRSGKPWSVTGGRGTAWGWIEIQAPPARRVAHDPNPLWDCSRPEENLPAYFEADDPGRNWYTSDADCAELAELLGLERVHCQGESVAASSAHRREYVARARGLDPLAFASPYWD